MKAIFVKGIGFVIGYILARLIALTISWLATCGVVKLITLCFGVNFTWGIGTGVWLMLFLIGSVTRGKK